jgi:hypothetical protein
MSSPVGERERWTHGRAVPLTLSVRQRPTFHLSGRFMLQCTAVSRICDRVGQRAMHEKRVARMRVQDSRLAQHAPGGNIRSSHFSAWAACFVMNLKFQTMRGGSNKLK